MADHALRLALTNVFAVAAVVVALGVSVWGARFPPGAGRRRPTQMLAGDNYSCTDPELVRMRAEAVVLCQELADADPHDAALNQSIIGRLFGKVGHTCMYVPACAIALMCARISARH